MSFNEWKEVKLVDICDLISRGVSPSYTEYKNEGIVVINQKCIRDNCINLELARLTNTTKKKITDNKYLKKYDILVNSTGVGTLGRVAQVKNINEEMTVDSHVTIVRAKNEVNPVFLGYNLFMKQRFIEYLGEGSTGQTELSRVRLGDAFKLKIPPIEEQKVIAKTLSDLDNKIEVNNKINKRLEDMAQSIFKHWFVDFEFPNEEGKGYKSSGGEMVESELGMIPKGWNTKELGKISDIQNGFAFKAPEYVNDGIKVMRTLNISNDGYFENDNIVYLPESYNDDKYSKYILNKFDINLVMVGASIGKIGMILENTSGSLQNQNMWRFRTCDENIPQLFLNYLIREAQIVAKNWSTGSAREFYRKDSFSKIQVIYPDKKILEEFNKNVKPLFELISKLSVENEKLVNARDTLLPKLMSGEIRVPIK